VARTAGEPEFAEPVEEEAAVPPHAEMMMACRGGDDIHGGAVYSDEMDFRADRFDCPQRLRTEAA